MCALISKIRSILLLFVTQATFFHCVTINKLDHPDIVAKTRIELRSISVPAFLNDVIRISAPMINEQSLYYLYKPNGDVMALDLHYHKLRQRMYEGDVTSVVAKHVHNVKPFLAQSNNYDVFSIRSKWQDKGESDVFQKKVKEMDYNDFMIGPLTLEDHGNWVLSIFTKDLDYNWIEVFQVITVTITEYLLVTPLRPKLNPGDTFNLSFAYPIMNLESCQLVAPRSTFDRLFGRTRIDMKMCGFTVPNITEEDRGLWRIIGVGKIVYEGEVYLDVETANNNSEKVNKTSSIY